GHRTRSGVEGDVHHWICGRGAKSRKQRAEECQGAVQALSSQGPCQRDRADARGLNACAATTQPIYDQPSIWARSSAGEHYLDMVGVTGSIPVAPTIRFEHGTDHENPQFVALVAQAPPR